ncbi:CocE/NonD family hydrolase C-terminal non-catalytic domain-containing protein [Kutzneria kofuensis]|uniref:CocE/NonD family hydrolase C-terminal non-catalytic domain-containing protein n=1 Tax=Kutzneria kofuensis TaxID=103725 RepID=UPI003CD07277
MDAASYPEVATATSLKLSATTTNGLGKLGSTAPKAGAVESFTDNPSLSETKLGQQPGHRQQRPGRVQQRHAVQPGDGVRRQHDHRDGVVVGQQRPGVGGARRPRAGDRAQLPGGRGGHHHAVHKSCFGSGTSGDTGCFLDTKADTIDVNAQVIARGWADLGHYASLTSKATLTPGKSYTMTFKLAPTDHQVAAGHRLALIVGGTDNGWITAGSAKPKITLDLTRTSVQVPLIGSLP